MAVPPLRQLTFTLPVQRHCSTRISLAGLFSFSLFAFFRSPSLRPARTVFVFFSLFQVVSEALHFQHVPIGAFVSRDRPDHMNKTSRVQHESR